MLPQVVPRAAPDVHRAVRTRAGFSIPRGVLNPRGSIRGQRGAHQDNAREAEHAKDCERRAPGEHLYQNARETESDQSRERPRQFAQRDDSHARQVGDAVGDETLHRGIVQHFGDADEDQANGEENQRIRQADEETREGEEKQTDEEHGAAADVIGERTENRRGESGEIARGDDETALLEGNAEIARDEGQKGNAGAVRGVDHRTREEHDDEETREGNRLGLVFQVETPIRAA